jgi:hypothetical protein
LAYCLGPGAGRTCGRVLGSSLRSSRAPIGAIIGIASVRAAHAVQFGRLAKDLARPPSWPGRDGLDWLELEHDNFRSALDWYGREDPSAALRLANRLTASGLREATSPRVGGAWASCWNWSQTTTPGGWTP